jgi:hypothetical protein
MTNATLVTLLCDGAARRGSAARAGAGQERSRRAGAAPRAATPRRRGSRRTRVSAWYAASMAPMVATRRGAAAM